MRRVSLDRPFSEGMITDLPAHELGPKNSVFAQDGFSPQGMFRQRAGWEYDGSVADVADTLIGVSRDKFTLTAVTKTVTCDDDGDMFIHEAAGAGTAIATGTVPYLPRAVYRDERLWCAQNGTTPLIRHRGHTTNPGAPTGTPTWTLGQATISAGTWGAAAAAGHFVKSVATDAATTASYFYGRVLNGSTTSATIEGVKASATVVTTPSAVLGCLANSWACVSVYDAGTLTVSGAFVATGYGTSWNSAYTWQDADHMLVVGASSASHGHLEQPSTATAANVSVGAFANKSAYSILRPMPFKDVAAHKGSLWGTGVAQYPTRVYVGPPNWDIGMPPGASVPYDPSIAQTSTNANDYVMDFVDVPAPDDTDAVVAILPSPNPLLVLKRQAVYGIYGSFGGLSVDMVADGVGCIDIRSAQSFDEGQFWAGEGGVYWYTGGQVRDLTAGRINREWRALTRDFDYGTSDFCTTWIASGHLFVGIITAAGTVTRTYVCDLRDGSWQSRFTNMAPRYGFTSRIPGEKEKALLVGGDIAQGRVANVAPCLDGSGTAKDDAGSFPRLQAYTSTALAQSGGIEGIARMVDLDIHTNLVDAGAAGATKITPTVVTGGGISNAADVSTALTAINSDTVDRIDRTSYRVAKQGRFHQARFAVGTLGTDTAATKVEIAQLVATFRDSRSRA